MNVFLTKGNGLTSTEANYYANLAKERTVSLVSSLEGITLYQTEVASITSETKQLMQTGKKSLDDIQPAIEGIAKLYELCAWLREAIKAKENLLKEIDSLSYDEWVEKQNIKLVSPVYPEKPDVITEYDILNSFNEEKRLKYLKLEATAATIGKYIHPNGSISNARKELLDSINTPIVKEGNGRDTLLFYYTPTVPYEDVEKLFITLQELHRANEQQLNYLKAEIKETVNKLNLEKQNEYEVALNNYHNERAAYDVENKRLLNQYQSWKISQREEIAKLKIHVPAELCSILDSLK